MCRGLGSLGLIAALLITLGAGALWFNRIPLLTWALTRTLEHQGLGPATFAIDAVDLHGIHVRDVALRDGELELADVTLSYNPLDLAAAHLGRVEIGRVVASLNVTGDGIEFGGQPLAAGTGGNSRIAGLRVDELILRDARLLIGTTAGPVETTLSASLALADGSVHSSKFAATVSVPIAGARHKMNIIAQKVSLEPQVEGGARLSFGRAAVTPEDLPWAAQAIDGEFVLNPDRTAARLVVGRLESRQQPMLVVPLSLTAAATLVGPLLEFTLQADTAGKAPLRLEARGRHDRSSDGGSANIVLKPIMFHRGSVQPSDLFPMLGGLVDDVEGEIEFGGSLRWNRGAVVPDLTFRLKDLAFAASGAQLRALKGEIKINRLWPPATPAGQTLTATIEAAGLPPANLNLRGQLVAGPEIKLDQIAIGIAGGEIVATLFSIHPDALEIETSLQVNGVDLAVIMNLIGIEGLTGTGQLDGRIPIALKDGKATISGGRLIAREPGLLRYRPSRLPPEIAGAGGSMELALQVLGDFQYEHLMLDLDKSSDGGGTVLLQLEGRNPAVMSGQAFNFNIRIDSNFDRLAGYALVSLRSAQELLRRAARRAGR
jgi:hypothetical protein